MVIAREKTQGGVMGERILKRVAGRGLTEKVTIEHRFKGGEDASNRAV